MNHTIKVFAPVITHDVTLPNTAKRVPMVMVPVPDSRTLMAIPISTLSQLKDSGIDTVKDEQQARDLLIWNDGVGTLDGCDLRFKINQLGCLELIDSDDESENQNIPNAKQNAISTNSSQASNDNSIVPQTSSNQVSKASSLTDSSTTTTISPSTNGLADVSTDGSMSKKAKLDSETAPVKQISPGSSLLRDKPSTKRPKSTSGSNPGGTNKNINQQTSSISLLRKVELNQNSILLDKLLPKHKLDDMKTNDVDKWTVEDVRRFVDSIPGCTGYGELFESQQICGKSLMYLDQRDMLDVINVKLGPAVKIYHAISLLK